MEYQLKTAIPTMKEYLSSVTFTKDVEIFIWRRGGFIDFLCANRKNSPLTCADKFAYYIVKQKLFDTICAECKREVHVTNT